LARACIWFSLLLVGCGGEVSSTDSITEEARPMNVRALWVWHSTDVSDAKNAQALFAFAQKKHVNRLYIQSQSLLSTTSGRASLAAFCDDAHALAIKVELLFGDSSWALTKNHTIAIDLAQAAVDFNATLTGGKPAGVRFDVEPNLLPEWDADQNGTANEYIDLLESLHSTLAGSGLKLAVDFNFSFAHRSIKRNGVTRNLTRWLAAATDWSTVMAYRDHATGSNGIIDIATGAVADATLEGKSMIVGVNTSCHRPAHTSFCGLGDAVLQRELDATVAGFASKQPIAGVAVHDYTDWQALGK
jgi:hypothetical protein